MNKQSGSAIFLIFIAIILFAALAYAVAQQLRVTNKDLGVSKEKMDLQITEILQFNEALKLRFEKLTLVDGINELNVSFKTDIYKRVNGTTMCQNENANCADASCMMFSPESPDGVRPRMFTEITMPNEETVALQSKNGTLLIGQLAVQGVGTSAPDLVIRINGVTPEFCNYYNSRQGITTNLTNTSVLSDLGEVAVNSLGQNWGGCLGGADFDTTHVFGDQATQYAGKRTFCAPNNPSADNKLSITSVIKAR